MNNTKMMAKMLTIMLFLVVSLTISKTIEQNKSKAPIMKNCCSKKNGKMMCMKDGEMILMSKDMKMKNGTTCMVNGTCVMKVGKKITMKERD